MLIVTSDAFLTLHYRLSSPDGRVWIDTFEGQPATLSLGKGEMSPALEAHLVGMKEGERKTVRLQKGEAFGEREAEKIQWVTQKLLATYGASLENVSVGDVIQFPSPTGQNNLAGTLIEMHPEKTSACFDFNHPLAGHETLLEVEIIGIL